MTQALGPSPFPPRDPADSLNSAPPTIYDPYLVPVARPARPKLSGFALGSVIVPFVLGPVGSVAAIALGWAARRDIEAHRTQRRGHRLATVGMVLGVLSMIAWAAGAVVAAWILIERSAQRPVTALPTPVKVMPSDSSDPSTGAQTTTPGAQAPAPAASAPEPQPGGSVPRATVVKREGAITVVDIGVSARSLPDELNKQLTAAKAAGETMLVMTTRDVCDPCRGVERSLSDPLLQKALAKVRVVRVDVDVFHEDLDQLKIPRRTFPGFFLLLGDLSIRDGINGGEWDDDIPVNIAPVLGPFVRGEYTKRREPWHPPPGTGIAL